jgi:hypothetical protein
VRFKIFFIFYSISYIMTKILSFDVGIKNLAFCFLDYNKEESKINNIISWGIINCKSELWMPEQNNKKCTKCGKGTNYWIVKDGVRTEMCKVHVRPYEKDYIAQVKTSKNQYNQVESLGYEYYPYELRDLHCPCGEKSRKFFIKYDGDISLNNVKIGGFCNKCSKEVEKSGQVLTKISDYLRDDDTKTYTRIYDGLSNLKLDGVNEIIIENQPALKNPKMKSVQLFIYTYFFCKLKEGKFPELANVSFFNASRKLFKKEQHNRSEEEPSKEPKEPQAKMSDYQSYKKRKNDSIDIVKGFLQDLGEWSAYFQSHPKKDDLADSLLQGVMFFA